MPQQEKRRRSLASACFRCLSGGYTALIVRNSHLRLRTDALSQLAQVALSSIFHRAITWCWFPPYVEKVFKNFLSSA